MSEAKVTQDLSVIKEFNIHVDRWSTYMSRLGAWFGINDIKPANQSKYLIAVVGTEALDLIEDLCYPDKPETLQIDVIHNLVEEHLSPKRTVMAARMILRSCKQVEGQTIGDYLVQLKKLSKPCKFSSNDALKENLRDQFVFGLYSERIKQRIVTEKDGHLTFARASELALSLETAVRDSCSAEAGRTRDTGGGGGEEQAVCAVQARAGGGGRRGRALNQGQGWSGPPGGVSGGARQRCYRCDGRHSRDECLFINSECYVCGRKGHIAKVCHFRKQKTVHGVDPESEASSSSGSESCQSLDVYVVSVDDSPEDQRWNIHVKVNSIPIVMEGDTGSAVSVISYGTFKSNFQHCKLLPYFNKLNVYSGQSVKPKGYIECTVEINGKLVNGLRLIVIDNNISTSLFGRDWMRCFGIDFPNINSTSSISIPCSDEMASLKKLYRNVSEFIVGTITKCKIRLEVTNGAVSVWRRARAKSSYALRSAGDDAELTRFESKGSKQFPDRVERVGLLKSGKMLWRY